EGQGDLQAVPTPKPNPAPRGYVKGQYRLARMARECDRPPLGDISRAARTIDRKRHVDSVLETRGHLREGPAGTPARRPSRGSITESSDKPSCEFSIAALARHHHDAPLAPEPCR